MTYQEKMNQLKQLQNQVNGITSIVNSKEKSIKLRESQLKQNQRQLNGMRGFRGMGDDGSNNNPASNLQANIADSAGSMLTPGNIGDINSVIWPFYFPTDLLDSPLGPNETFQTGFSVTQEAAFIFMSFTKAVYLVEGEDPDASWTYLDPDQQNPSAPGLTFTLRDGSSSRQLFNQPIPIDPYGNPRFPTKFPRPTMLLPNQVMQIQFTNSHPTNVYYPIITAFGYRVRIDQAQNLLSLVYA